MNASELRRWQWEGYSRYHQSRGNLLLHMVMVPLFLIGNTVLLIALAQGLWLMAMIALSAMVVSIAAQGRGHAKERVPPEPFTSKSNAVSRILLEQWITFPRFVLTGGWLSALRRTAAP
nr:Mpo1-like protein [uncultured Roseateles sp.]